MSCRRARSAIRRSPAMTVASSTRRRTTILPMSSRTFTGSRRLFTRAMGATARISITGASCSRSGPAGRSTASSRTVPRFSASLARSVDVAASLSVSRPPLAASTSPAPCTRPSNVSQNTRSIVCAFWVTTGTSPASLSATADAESPAGSSNWSPSVLTATACQRSRQGIGSGARGIGARLVRGVSRAMCRGMPSLRGQGGEAPSRSEVPNGTRAPAAGPPRPRGTSVFPAQWRLVP